MKSTPILFTDPMIRAILAGKKTQTRRIAKDRHYGTVPLNTDRVRLEHDQSPVFVGSRQTSPVHHIETWRGKCPYGTTGDQLWVRETFATGYGSTFYKATDDLSDSGMKVPWKSPLFMPRAASRITLEVVSVRVERLNEISEEDAIAEGVLPPVPTGIAHHALSALVGDGWRSRPFASSYAQLWESIHGPGSWALNPYVWVVTFKRVKP